MTQLDGDKLAAGLRRVTPFMSENGYLYSVFAESHGGKLELTTTDGFRMAHLTLPEIAFPEGDSVLDGAGCKDFATRHYNGEQIEVIQDTKGNGSFKLGDVTVPRLNAVYPDYRQVIPTEFETIVDVETKTWVKPIRQNCARTVGVVISEKGCRLYFQSIGGETTAFADVPVQLISGPERKVAAPLSWAFSFAVTLSKLLKPSLQRVGNHVSRASSLATRWTTAVVSEAAVSKFFWSDCELPSLRPFPLIKLAQRICKHIMAKANRGYSIPLTSNSKSFARYVMSSGTVIVLSSISYLSLTS